MRAIHLSASSLILLFALIACTAGEPPARTTTASLYDRLGGKPAISKVVDAFVARVAADSRINGYFAHADIPKLKQHLVDQICEGSGGPCKYTGRSMKDTHVGMGITSPAFDALVEDLVKALDEFKVGETEKAELLSILGPMRADIVERPS
jgi:hemoglobin